MVIFSPPLPLVAPLPAGSFAAASFFAPPPPHADKLSANAAVKAMADVLFQCFLLNIKSCPLCLG
jgi:hypothetical protein